MITVSLSRFDPIVAPPCVPAGERIYAIGDIHGRIDLFQALLDQIRRDNEARDPATVRLILLGDIIDRGPASAELVARCRALSERSDRFVVLKGNHEAMMVDALGGNLHALALWLRNGGDAALASWGVDAALIAEGPPHKCIADARAHVPAATIAWLRALPTTLRIGDYLFVHAGIRPGVPLADQTEPDLLWIRREFLDSGADHGLVVVHGHSISARGPELRANRIGIDTGAYRTGSLTALMLEGSDRLLLSTGPGEAA
ncbi:metallophosphoesterase family protein [Sphingomonas profundi]|uniref:metallophosphoesterase family protein n=1 Tax=Alterirhizorhabdus profundi TaxID=2681549 RepID=UPI0012E87DDA|nr:metallophosphoesterase family protein [Sphingomonas profundi]